MPDISITVRSKIAESQGLQQIVCGNSDYVAVFDLDSDWDDKGKDFQKRQKNKTFPQIFSEQNNPRKNEDDETGGKPDRIADRLGIASGKEIA